ncbi:hypothetical protein [Frankia sp. AiPa1]|uniref:hypothetical protein n=1 Tax=Frankia sp. AiPa1 TaxID=573492 RepID=UPI00202B3CB3|nr:hypothetical protein [Frankia sp. AiPa1]MCL9759547.1 hypothetical protein [Frankia sp. AiPa1]
MAALERLALDGQPGPDPENTPGPAPPESAADNTQTTRPREVLPADARTATSVGRDRIHAKLDRLEQRSRDVESRPGVPDEVPPPARAGNEVREEQPESTDRLPLPREPEKREDLLAAIYAASEKTEAGRSFYPPSESNTESARLVAPEPGYYTVDIHGDPSGCLFGTERLDAHDVAQLIRTDRGWDHRPVRLLSCETGKGDNPMAQKLANELGRNVLAPTENAWVDCDTGEIVISSTVNENGFKDPAKPYNEPFPSWFFELEAGSVRLMLRQV